MPCGAGSGCIIGSETEIGAPTTRAIVVKKVTAINVKRISPSCKPEYLLLQLGYDVHETFAAGGREGDFKRTI